MIIVYILLVLFIGVWYWWLLTKYTQLWISIDTSATEGAANKFSVSIIIPFRNEADNLNTLLHSLDNLKTEKHDVEIIFINDHSSDEGVRLINEYGLSQKYVIISLDKESGKKGGIAVGWAAAQGDIILQTDADCRLEPNWLVEMVKPFADEQINLVSGPVAYLENQGFLNHLLALDFAALITIGASHIQWGQPLICNGANLAYRISLTTHANLNSEKASGDDVFLLQSAYLKNPRSILFLKLKEAIVKTNSPKTFGEFWNQRLRWSSKNGDYAIKKNVWILVGVWFFNILILTSLISLQPIGLLVAVFLILIKILAEEKFYKSFIPFFQMNKWFKTILLGQPFHILYMTILPPLSQLLRYKWKGRKLK